MGSVHAATARASARLFRDLVPWRPVGDGEAERDETVSAWASEAFSRPPLESPENDRIPAGYTYFGQFIAHDLTFESAKPLSRTGATDDGPGVRSPELDLDSVYGGGPTVDAHLYDGEIDGPNRGYVFRLRAATVHDRGVEWDVPRVEACYARLVTDDFARVFATEGEPPEVERARIGLAAELQGFDRHAEVGVAVAGDRLERVETDPQDRVSIDGRTMLRVIDGDRVWVRRDGRRVLARIAPEAITRVATRALIADPRNDDNVLVSQLHLAFLRVHNRVMGELASQGMVGAEAFEVARQRVRWSYQWLVLEDYLPRILGAKFTQRLKRGEEGKRLFRLVPGASLPVEFTAACFRFGHAMIRPTYHLNDYVEALPFVRPHAAARSGAGADLRGGRGLPPRWTTQWNRFFDSPNEESGTPAWQASLRIGLRLDRALERLPVPMGPRSLSELDLRRGWMLGLPSGERVAEALGVKPLPPAEGRPGDERPLWTYVLEEAESKHGFRLGPVGRRVVGEVFLGLLTDGSDSYLRAQRRWTPPWGRNLYDLLRWSGAPMTKDDLPFDR